LQLLSAIARFHHLSLRTQLIFHIHTRERVSFTIKMHATAALRNAARTPLIKFIGKRTTPTAIDHTPKAHPASPSTSLPDSFASYRAKAQQHGPLNNPARASSSAGAIGAATGASLGPIEPNRGQFFDRDDLPARFRRLPWSELEIEAIETGGASLVN
jgi:small subunit ribosomal protein YMR-31